MTPKLYEDLNHKFFSIWGDFAGWAHSVSFPNDFLSLLILLLDTIGAFYR